MDLTFKMKETFRTAWESELIIKEGNIELELRRIRICELERELATANEHLYPPMDEDVQEKHNGIQGI